MKFRSASERILDIYARQPTADGDTAPGGGSQPAPVVPPAAGDAAPAAGAAPAAPTSLLSEPPAAVVEPPKPAETEDEKAARLAAETPEQKAEREKAEGEARVLAMKPYDALTLPEGMPADQPAFVDFKKQALDLGVEPEKAQKLIDTVAPKMKEAMEAPYNLWADTQVAWVNEVKADPILGKDLDKSLAIASRAIDSFGTPEDAKAVRNALAFTGAGNNPAIVRWMHAVGLTLKEGVPVSGKPAAADKTSFAASLYPSMQPNPT